MVPVDLPEGVGCPFREILLPDPIKTMPQIYLSQDGRKLVVAGCNGLKAYIYVADYFPEVKSLNFSLVAEVPNALDVKAVAFSPYTEEIACVLTMLDLKGDLKLNIKKEEDVDKYEVWETVYVFAKDKGVKQISLSEKKRHLGRFTEGRGTFDLAWNGENALFLAHDREVFRLFFDGKRDKLYESSLKECLQLRLIQAETLALYEVSTGWIREENSPVFILFDERDRIAKKKICPRPLEPGNSVNVIFDRLGGRWGGASITGTFEKPINGFTILDSTLLSGKEATRVFFPEKVSFPLTHGIAYSFVPDRKEILVSYFDFAEEVDAKPGDNATKKSFHFGILTYP